MISLSSAMLSFSTWTLYVLIPFKGSIRGSPLHRHCYPYDPVHTSVLYCHLWFNDSCLVASFFLVLSFRSVCQCLFWNLHLDISNVSLTQHTLNWTYELLLPHKSICFSRDLPLGKMATSSSSCANQKKTLRFVFDSLTPPTLIF